MRTTGLLPIEQEAMEASLVQFEDAKKEVLQYVVDFLESRNVEELQDTPVWRTYKSGDVAFFGAVSDNVSHVERILCEDILKSSGMLRSTLKTLLVHTVIWLAWRIVVDRQTPIGNSYSTSSVEETVQGTSLTTKEPTIPERPPDMTEPAPKPKRSLLGRLKKPAQPITPDVDTSLEAPRTFDAVNIENPNK